MGHISLTVKQTIYHVTLHTIKQSLMQYNINNYHTLMTHFGMVIATFEVSLINICEWFTLFAIQT